MIVQLGMKLLLGKGDMIRAENGMIRAGVNPALQMKISCITNLNSIHISITAGQYG